MGKHSKVSSSIEWRLGENVVLWPMECLTPSVKFAMFITLSHLFVCRPNLELATFEQQVCSTMQMHCHWEKIAARKGTWPLWIAHIKQKSNVTLSVLLWTYEIFLELEQSWKSNNQINSTVTTRTWVLLTEWTKVWAVTGLVSMWKNDCGPCLFEWWMLFPRVRGYCTVLTKMKALSVCLFQCFETIYFQWNFSEIIFWAM